MSDSIPCHALDRLNLNAAARALVESMPALVPTKRLADALGVTPRTLRAWRAQGRLDAVRTGINGGGRVLYTRDSVARLLSTFTGAQAV